MMDQPYVIMERIYGQKGMHSYVMRTDFYLTSRWSYLWICAGVGVLLLTAALLLYRRRKLETAGDFIAVKPLEPVFLVMYSWWRHLFSRCSIPCSSGTAARSF